MRLRVLGRVLWANRFEILGFGGRPDGALSMLCRLRATGLIWQGEPGPHDTFTFTVDIPRYYPLSPPGIRFVEPVPFCPHVVHEQFLPAMEHVPPEFQAYLRAGGHGNCCYLRSSQWSSDPATHDLAIVVWQLSRVVTLGKAVGEVQSLNPRARDHALRLAQADRLPLGKSLPYPSDHGEETQTTPCADEFAEDDIAWTTDRAGGERGEP